VLDGELYDTAWLSVVTAVVAPRKENTMTDRKLPISRCRKLLQTTSKIVIGGFGSKLVWADDLPKNTNPRDRLGALQKAIRTAKLIVDGDHWDQEITLSNKGLAQGMNWRTGRKARRMEVDYNDYSVNVNIYHDERHILRINCRV